MSFLSSTINGYEGTGRSLSLKLLKQLRQKSLNEAGENLALRNHTLHEMTLDESIRYKNGDLVKLSFFIGDIFFRLKNGCTSYFAWTLRMLIISWQVLRHQTLVNFIT